LSAELCGRKARARQPKRQCHSEAAGMGRGDQLFRIGALLILEAGFERIRGVGEHAGIGRQMTVARPPGAAPNCFRLADHVMSPLLMWLSALEFSTMIRPYRAPNVCPEGKRSKDRHKIVIGAG